MYQNYNFGSIGMTDYKIIYLSVKYTYILNIIISMIFMMCMWEQNASHLHVFYTLIIIYLATKTMAYINTGNYITQNSPLIDVAQIP